MRKVVFLLVLLLTFGWVKAEDVVFKAIAPQTVVVGSNFRLVYTINAEATDLRIPDLSDFEILSGPSPMTSQSTMNINGKMTSQYSLSLTYIVQAKKEGTFNVAPATIKAKGANYTSNALIIKVLPEDEKSKAANSAAEGADDGSGAVTISKNDVFLNINVSKRSVYEQEGFLVTFKLYSLRDIAGIEQLKLPEFEGFLVQDIELPQNRQLELDRYNDRNYYSVTIKQAVLYPQRSGNITIPSGKINVALRVPAPRRRARSIFDDFFDSGYQTVNKVFTSQPVTINVKSLPSGKPASFSGAVGNFKMNAALSSNNVKADEAVTLKMDISGTGNVKLVKNPNVVFPNDFEIYDPKVDNKIQTTTAGTSGTKSIEYMAIPRYAGDFEIPAVEFSYFDTKAGQYKTLSAGPYKLHVAEGEGGKGTAPVVSNFSNKENVKYLGKDIRYLKVKGFSFIQVNDLFFGSFGYVMSYVIPFLLFVVFFIVYRKQIKENANVALVRTKKANKTAVKRLKNAGKLLKENQKEAFYDEVLRALWGYLSDKLSIPLSNLTKDNVEAELRQYGVDDTLISEFMDILNTCEFARYAPSQASDAMDKIYEQTVDAIGKMENTIKK